MTRHDVPSTCPVSILADEAARVVAAHNEHDRLSTDRQGHERSTIERTLMLLYRRLDAMSVTIANTRASSLKGAAAQLCQIPAMADQLYELVENDDEKMRQARQIIDTLELIVYSATAVVRSAGSVEPDHGFLAYYMGTSADPHARIAAVCAPTASAGPLS